MTIEQFSFPLNVYARLLELLEGRVDYLHFPLFDGAGSSVPQAQERASALLWQALPPPCRLLEVGIGLGTTLARLSAAGYHALGITPEQAQIDEARRRHGDAVQLQCARLEEFDARAGQWDALLFQESAQYIEPGALFEAADRLLDPAGAHLVVMDEFALRRSDASHAGLHHLDHFCALAARHGWRLTQRADLSRDAAPTLDYLIDGTRSMRERLIADLGVGAVELDGLDAALRRHRALYGAGVYGYALLRFERERAPSGRIVQIDARHAERVRELFGKVFGHPLSADEWQWKYGDDRGRAVGLVRGDALLAHYAGAARDVIFHGRPALACQVCDVMVDTQARSALARNGPLYQLTASFLEAQIGWGRRHLIGFGFPTERAMAAAVRMGLYAAVDRMVCVEWPAVHSGRSVSVSCHALGADDLAPGAPAAVAIDRLWRAMAAALPEQTLGVRDARWVLHRFMRHPRFRYEVVLVRSRWLRRPIGVVVVRRHDTHLEWVDWIGPPAGWPRLLEVVRERAGAAALPRVDAWITQSQQHWLTQLVPGEGTPRPLGIDVPANAHSPGPSADDHRGRWWLTAGDTDFR